MRGAIEQYQNADGGWPYGATGPSWTEPTAFALLAQLARGNENSESIERGVEWLQTVQGSDGGWRPEASVEQSTWVGALVALLPDTLLPEARRHANLEWLLRQTGQESTRMFRLRQWLIGNSGPAAAGEGWPWYPGAAAWVTPTALTILALRKHGLDSNRMKQGQRFLLSHACAAGGWNHGGAQALGYQANPYPETTGIALLALSGTESDVKNAGLRAAQRFLPACRSVEGNAWLSLGLHANQSLPHAAAETMAEPRTIVDLSLLTLAARARAGFNVLLS